LNHLNPSLGWSLYFSLLLFWPWSQKNLSPILII
jgi:hypothetical protein